MRGDPNQSTAPFHRTVFFFKREYWVQLYLYEGLPVASQSRPPRGQNIRPAFYLSEQITVASCTGQSQCQDIFFDFINQQPIRQDMAFTESNVISG